MITVERLLTNLANQAGVAFHVQGQPFEAEHVFANNEFSFLPVVVLQAARLRREYFGATDREQPDLCLGLVGASITSPGDSLGPGVSLRPLACDELGVERGLLFQQAAEQIFGWEAGREVDLHAVMNRFMQDGYAEEREALESYTAFEAARHEAQRQSMEMVE
ncbi:MAG: hypothetical protein EPN79_11380 [Burkholderiaceae bacterium]|nr:MAG: hypothetical protein EPN79_11380 [Burkholderiaceae bacterium]TBR76714.1 MAG: hypothetical protein EPN64_05690 [Burkholderiaceae bacterium]